MEVTRTVLRSAAARVAEEAPSPTTAYSLDSWATASLRPVAEDSFFVDNDPEPDDDWDEPAPLERVLSRDFPTYELPAWSLQEREEVVTQWFRQMEYRIKWIFYREEREGINRTRFINAFSPDDFKTRAAKAGRPHPLDTETSKFYDWNLGGSDFIMRLESFEIKNRPVLRLHFIHRPTDKEVCYEDRIWDGDAYYRECNQVWANTN
jgi:hypothetical protein